MFGVFPGSGSDISGISLRDFSLFVFCPPPALCAWRGTANWGAGRGSSALSTALGCMQAVERRIEGVNSDEAMTRHNQYDEYEWEARAKRRSIKIIKCFLKSCIFVFAFPPILQLFNPRYLLYILFSGWFQSRKGMCPRSSCWNSGHDPVFISDTV